MPFGSKAYSQRDIDSVEQFHRQPRPGERADHYTPRVYFETKIDFADVRSGFHGTVSICKSVEPLPLEMDLLWTPDMVSDEEPLGIVQGVPDTATRTPLPEFLRVDTIARMETLFLNYLMRHHHVRIYRNFTLNTYSHTGESQDEFRSRCVELLADSFKREMDSIREVVLRRMERLRERYQKGPAEDFGAVKSSSHWKSRMHQVSERLTNLFLETELGDPNIPSVPDYPLRVQEVTEEPLLSLEMETRKEISRLHQQYLQDLSNVDEYYIRPNFKDVHVGRSGILWIPAEEVA